MLTVSKNSENLVAKTTKKIVYRIRAARFLVAARIHSRSGNLPYAERWYKLALWYHEQLQALGFANEIFFKDLHEVKIAIAEISNKEKYWKSAA
ncbi:MAG: hypothetical protein ACK452_03935 [Bacteroidota bacterium]